MTSPPTSKDKWYSFASISNYFYGDLMISDSQLFFIGVYFYDQTIINMLKVTIGNSHPDWALKTEWVGDWLIGCSTSILSSDGTNIYTFHVYGNPNALLMFTTFSKSTGSIVGSRFVSNIAISNAYWAKQNGDYLSVNVQAASSSYLVLYNINSTHISILLNILLLNQIHVLKFISNTIWID